MDLKLEVIRRLLTIYKNKELMDSYPLINKEYIAKYMQGLVGVIKILVNLDINNKNESQDILIKLRTINFHDRTFFDDNVENLIESCTKYSIFDEPIYLNKINEYLDECQIFLNTIIS